jgi:hypothetical protein
MTDLEKAARMALEAMGLIGADLVCDAAHHKKADRHGIGERCPIQARWHHAFAALRQALSDSVEQPAKQRHIAYVCPQCYWTLEERPAHQKPWVGLTDEQIDRAIAELGLNYLADVANNRAVLRELCRKAANAKEEA